MTKCPTCNATLYSCTACRKLVLKGQLEINWHDVCIEERKRREKNGMCIFCNKKKSTLLLRCEDHMLPSPRYSGYGNLYTEPIDLMTGPLRDIAYKHNDAGIIEFEGRVVN